MPALHKFEDAAALHGKALCGVDVKPDKRQGSRTWWDCPACTREVKRRNARTYHERLAED